jgi:transcription antitermination factor NusG
MAEESYRWHILIASPGQEIKAGDGLHSRRLETFVPKIGRAQRAGRGNVRVVARPMFPCYVFANLPTNHAADGIVRATPGIHGFMMVEADQAIGERRLYATLPDEAIDMMRFTEAEIEEDRCRKFNRPPAFIIGQRVAVPKGRWSEFTGKIKSLHGNVADVVLEMAILGRDTVRVEVQNLRQAG